jgi:hypothetical protein
MLPKQAYESAAEIDRVVCNMVDIHEFLKNNDENRLPDILFNTTGNTEFCSDEVRAKLRSHSKRKESRLASYKIRARELFDRFVKRIRRIREENGLENILEDIDKEIKNEKGASQG